MRSVCPFNVYLCVPVTASQRRIVLSQLPRATVRTSGLKATLETLPVYPPNWTGRRIPQREATVPTRDGKRAAIEGDANTTWVPVQRAMFSPVSNPKAHRFFVVLIDRMPAGKRASVRAVRYAEDTASIPDSGKSRFQYEFVFPRRHIPQID